MMLMVDQNLLLASSGDQQRTSHLRWLTPAVRQSLPHTNTESELF